MIEIEVRVVDDRRSKMAAVYAWVAALWWPALLLACAWMAVANVRHIDDGDPTVRFASMWDLALVCGLVSALTLEARRVVVALVAWRQRRAP